MKSCLRNLLQLMDVKMIRITGGLNRSRKLNVPTNGLTKPTMDKVRAAVFNALNEDIINKDVLDLFAGSGSYGLEALSRGAKKATFVDKEKEAVEVIKNNVELLKEENAKIVRDDVISYLRNTKDKFDVIFVDPPYRLEVYEIVLDLLNKNELLNKNAIIVLESERELNIKEENYKKVKLYNYGLAKIYILRK